MRRMALSVIVLVALAALACGWPETSQERASWFFDRGEEWIVESLEDVEAADDQLEAARRVIGAHEPEVTAALEAFFAQHGAVLRSVAGGSATEELLAREEDLHEAHRRALERIGAMHEELATTLGRPTWEEARARMQERAAEHLGDG